MAFADGSLLRVAYVAETAFGVAPATPGFQVLRTTGGGIDVNKSTAVSDEIRPDRNVSDEMLLGIDWEGSYNFELSYGSFDALIAAALHSTWVNDVVKNGVTPVNLMFEETLPVGATNYFSRFLGARIGKLDLNITGRRQVTGSFAIWAQRELNETAAIAGATYTAANTNPVLTASANVAGLVVPGAAIQPKVKSLTLSVENNMRKREQVGDLYSAEFGAGNCDVTGSAEVYFDSHDLYKTAIAHGGGALSFTIGAGAGQRYTVSLPNIVFQNVKKSPRAKNTDVMVTLPFRARFDTTLGASIGITRNV